LETTLKGASLQNGQSISKWKSSIQVDLKKNHIFMLQHCKFQLESSKLSDKSYSIRAATIICKAYPYFF